MLLTLDRISPTVHRSRELAAGYKIQAATGLCLVCVVSTESTVGAKMNYALV